jgi:hypothetical protein
MKLDNLAGAALKGFCRLTLYPISLNRFSNPWHISRLLYSQFFQKLCKYTTAFDLPFKLFALLQMYRASSGIGKIAYFRIRQVALCEDGKNP